MKYMKTLGLAAVAATALMAFVGAGTASATVICSATETPCSAANKWAVGTKIGFESEGSILLKETGASGETLDTCKKSKVTGELTSAGSSTTNPTGPISTLDWEECTWTTTTVSGFAGKLEVTGPLTGTSSGTVTDDTEVRLTISIPFFGSCVYGLVHGNPFGVLTEGNPPTLHWVAVGGKLTGSSITCPETANWSGTYKFFEPSTTGAVEPS